MSSGFRYDELQLARVLARVGVIGPKLQQIAQDLGMTVGQVAGVKRRYREQWDEALALFESQPAQVAAPLPEEELTIKGGANGTMEYESRSATIRTVEDLLEHIDADLTKFEVERFEATANQQPSKDADDEIQITPYFRVWVRLRPKGAAGVLEAVETMVRTFEQESRRPTVRPHKPKGDLLQKLVIADPHIAKYAWAKSTGSQNWDVDLAVQAILNCSFELLDEGDEYRHAVGRRTIALLGDYFHFDTPSGTTTSGTPLERDSRLQRMIEHGTDALVQVIDRSAATVPTHIVLVPGNHDTTLSWAMQRILQAHYRNDERVTIDPGYHTRKYERWGLNLFGYTHGDKARKDLGTMMATEVPQDWGATKYREFHTGHLHQIEEKVRNYNGVLVRTAPAICPPDDWHAEHGFIGALRAMESFLYVKDGGLVGSFVSSPDYLFR